MRVDVRPLEQTEIEWQLLQKDPGNPENSGILALGGQVLARTFHPRALIPGKWG
jgi:hypothetical protein